MDRTKYPWRPRDLKYGDYERVYDTIFNKRNPLYLSTYKDTELVEVRKVNIEMQFGRFITDFDDLMIIQKQIDTFMNHLDSKPIKLFAFQLACTCHWVSLLVAVVNKQIFFYYFDSKNIDCYGLNAEQIASLVNKINLERAQVGKPLWCEFKKTCQMESMKDINILLKLIPDIFMKKTSIYEYIFNTLFKGQYAEYWKPSIVAPLEKFKRTEMNLVHDHLVDYLGDLKTFIHYFYHLTHAHGYLTTESKEGMLEVYLECFALFDRCLPTISRYKKGRELNDTWQGVKNNLGKHFQPSY